MLRLVSDKPRYRWGDPIVVSYTGDAEDVQVQVYTNGTAELADGTLVPYSADMTFGAAYARPQMDGYGFAPYDSGHTRWHGGANEDQPPGVRTATIGGAVTTLRGTTSTSCTVDLGRMGVGWCPGLRAGEGAVDAIRRMLADYPTPSVVRLFFAAGKGLPAWDTGPLAEIPDEVDLIVISVKDWPVDVAAWLSVMPEKFRGRIVLILDHEPEQQDGGDPTPAEFKAEWAALVAALRDHPRRGDIRLALCFTRAYWRTHPQAFDEFMPVDVLDGIDEIWWDVYDPLGGESPDSILSIPRQVRFRTGKPYGLAELGIGRRADDPTGERCADDIDAVVVEARADGCVAVAWFHRDAERNYDLTDDQTPRPVEAQKLADLIAGA